MKSKVQHYSSLIIRLIGSDIFFVIILGLFILQVGWLAASASFPMLFDEYYHATIIDRYSIQYSPIVTSQTDEFTQLNGVLTRSPSYLFHYLLSFPYRFIASFTNSFYITIVSLRLINVAFVAIGLVMFRRLFNAAGFSKPVVNTTILILILIPNFNYVAAHISYDNLLFLLTPIFLLLGLKIITARQPNPLNIVSFLSVGMLASLVKYTFLPILFTATLFVAVNLVRKSNTNFFKNLFEKIKKLKLVNIALALLLLVVSLGLFIERYGGNVYNYGNLNPSCQAVEGEEACYDNRFVRRARDAKLALQNEENNILNVEEYYREVWLPYMVEGVTIVGVNEPFDNFEDKPLELIDEDKRTGANPPSFLNSSIWFLGSVGILFIAFSFKKLSRKKGFWYFSIITASYILVLFLYINYKSYLGTGEAYAIQFRYLLTLLPILIIFTIESVRLALKSPLAKLIVLAVVLAIFTQGGGIGTYIVSSDYNWYWQRKTIIETNLEIQTVLQSIIYNHEDIYKGH